MQFLRKLSIFLTMISLSSCATNPSTPLVIDKSHNPSSARVDVDICNVNNVSRKIVTAKSACFETNPQFQSNLPTCDKSQHPHTWTGCFGILESPRRSGGTLQAEFESGAPIRGLVRNQVYYYIGGFRNYGPDGIGVYSMWDSSFRALWENGRIKEVFLSNFSPGSRVDDLHINDSKDWSNKFLLEFLSLIPHPSQFPCPGNDIRNWTFCKKEILFDDGEKYTGTWKNGVFDGEGEYHYKDGSLFKGEWKDGKKHGQGSLRSTSSKWTEQYWFEGALKTKDEFFRLKENRPIYSKQDLTAIPQVATTKAPESSSLSKLQMEVFQKEREQGELAARQAEEKRLQDRLAELNRQSQVVFNDDLPGLISKLPAARANPRLHVLVIGINDYADVPDVPFADRSAKQFAEISQKLLGAQPQNVIVLTNSQATLGRLLSRLNTLLNRLGPQDQFLLYYAGHGVPGKDGFGAYLLAQDGGPGSYEQPDLQLGQIYSVIAKSRVGQASIFIDACFSGRSGKDSIVFEGVAPIVVQPKQSFPDSDRMAVITAGRGDQFSNQEKSTGHRLFSYHLMRLILDGGFRLEIGQLHQRLKQRVLEESRRIGPEFEQEPDLQGNRRMTLLN
jgi:hypothetical protein